ncbi:hypothetical protein AGMMS49592_4050 [Endomicrobiia bacterium]|nr:hypothetical protein AGMMS49592_4050 [Endomicrobiia bacterium]
MVHEIWRKRFALLTVDMTVKYFTQSWEAIDFINSLKDKSNVLLTDYELRTRNINDYRCNREKLYAK